MSLLNQGFPQPTAGSVAVSVAQPVARSVTGSVNVPPAAPIIASVTISGGTLVGDVLSSSISYTQVPVPSATPSYQWDRDGSPISGATSASYTLVEADAGAAITLDVSVTNSEGSDSATSNTINAAALAAPSITGVPTISGTLFEGNTLTATAASVTGNPTPATTWQWERDGTPISGATSQTYTLVSADGNTDITVVQTETNSQGSDTAESAASTIEAAPVISGVPTISGSESVGSTLTATAASVTGTPTPTRTWQWQRSADGSTGWTNISGATASTYTLVSADLNQYIRVSQIETNTSGGQTRADSAESAATGQITDLSEYAANGFDPDYVADFSATDADYFRVAGADSDFATAFTSDSEGGGLATMVDSSGNLVWRAHNLVTYSEQFDNAAWSKNSLVLTANATVAPDGSTTADLFQENGTTADRAAYQDTLSVVVGVKYNFAMCVKNYGGLADRWAQLRVYGDGFGRAYANINPRDGTIGAEGGSAYDDVVVTSLGNGWYLAEIQGLEYSAVSGNEGVAVYIASSATAVEVETYAGDGDSGFYIWGAHVYRSDLGGMADNPDAAVGLEKYVPTTAAARYLARRRHHRWDGSAWVPTCLHEPVSSTNEFPYSNDFTNAAWLKSGLSVTANQGVGPDGNTSLDQLELNAGSGVKSVSDVITLGSVGDKIALQIYGRYTNHKWWGFRYFDNNGVWATIVFDIDAKTVTQESVDSGADATIYEAEIESLEGGLFRAWVVVQGNNRTNGTFLWQAHSSATPTLDGNAGSESWTAAGTETGQFGFAQCETPADLPSSYIPTNGTAQPRTADTLKGKAASFPWSTTAVSMAIKGRHNRVSGAAATLLARYEDADDALELRVDSSDNAEAYAETGGSSQTASGGAVATGADAEYSLAMRYVAGSAIQVATGGTAGSEVTASVPATPPLSDDDVLILEGSGTGDVNGTVDRVIGWDEDIATAGVESGSASVEIQGVPTISGTEAVGSTLTASAATVVGGPSPSTTWQWQRSANGTSGWADISGATSSTYTLVSADEDQYVRAVQTATVTAGGDTYTDSANSVASGQITAGVVATGGTVTDAGGFRYHTFTSGGTLTVASGGSVEYLVVAGGGGGGGPDDSGTNRYSGGGGAGGFLSGSTSVVAQTYAITVGAGGAAGATGLQGADGANSAFGAIATATGGGGGGSAFDVAVRDGRNGGSGGGGGESAGVGGSGIAGQGNDGGNSGAGGGGAGAAASDVSGGAGAEWPTGSGTFYAGGGGGTNSQRGSGSGGSGGGGDAASSGVPATAGAANTGGGGGSGIRLSGVPYAAGDGGSGIVVVRYAL